MIVLIIRNSNNRLLESYRDLHKIKFSAYKNYLADVKIRRLEATISGLRQELIRTLQKSRQGFHEYRAKMKKLLARKDAKIKRLEDKIAKQVNP